MTGDKKNTILIVDDDPLNLDVLNDFLNREGFRVSVALSGKEALDRVTHLKPDIIILDVMMPGMSGFEVCRRLKEDKTTKDIPVIFMTVLSETIDKVKGFELGAVDFVSKPVQVEEVAARLNTHLTLRRLRKDLEEKNLRLKAALSEKEVLLKEIHHRVKNNLQIINSLINMQLRKTGNPETATVLEDVKNRVNSITLIHEKLYKSENLSGIDFCEYISTLTKQLLMTYQGRTANTRLNLDISDICLEIDQAIPCALIINELATNAMKHAFPKGRQGRVTVALKTSGTGKLRLTVADNGIGLPADFDVDNLETLGIQIIKALVTQLRGVLQVNGSKGTTFTIEFQAKGK